jgi:hypothetical protein
VIAAAQLSAERARLREEWPRAWRPIKPGERTSLGPAGSWGPSACATGSPPLLGRIASGGCWRGDPAVRLGAWVAGRESATAPLVHVVKILCLATAVTDDAD